MQASEMYGKAKVRLDSWINEVTGFGVAARDKLVNAVFQRSAVLTATQLEDLFNGDSIAAKVVGKVVDDALRGSYSIEVGAEDADEAVSKAAAAGAAVYAYMEDELKASANVEAGWNWGRLFGGGAIYLVADEGYDAPQDLPLDESRLRSVLALTTLDVRDIVPHSVYSDPSSPKFGSVEVYRVNRTSSTTRGTPLPAAYIHESRLIIFEGRMTTNRERQRHDGWSLSVLQRVHDKLRTYNQSFASLGNLVQDASQGIFSMEGLIDMIGGGQENDVEKRIGLADLQRSNARTLVIDAGMEKFERMSPALTGYPEALQLFMLDVCEAADMPASVLFGRSPAGMNATGESDRLLWAQTVEAERRKVAHPALSRIAQLVFRSSEGPTGGTEPDAWEIEWPALIHQTDSERATIRKTVAETDDIYMRHGALLPEEVAINRFRAGGWNPETKIDIPEREAILKDTYEQISASAADDAAAQPTTGPTTTPTPTDQAAPPTAPPAPTADIQKTAYNGSQVSGLLDIVTRATAGTIPRSAATEMLVVLFPLARSEAEAIMRDVPLEPEPPVAAAVGEPGTGA